MKTNLVKYHLVAAIIVTCCSFAQAQGDKPSQLKLTLGGTWTRHIIAGGWGVAIGYLQNRSEVTIGGEFNSGQSGLISTYRRYFNTPSIKIIPFVSVRASYYADKWRIGLAPGYMVNANASIGIKYLLSPRFSVQGQLGLGYGGYFRQNGEPFFIPTWLPTRMLHFGVGYDLPLRRGSGGLELAQQPTEQNPKVSKLSILLHTGLQINYLAPPSFERFTAGLGYDVHPHLAVTLRHQAVRTVDGLKYGKSLIGVRWMPGNGTRLRWVGSLEAGHWGSVLNFQSPIGAFGVMAGQHLQYPVLPGVAAEVGLQYALLKAPQPLQPASSDFETSLGLVIRPGAWRKH